MATLIDGTTLNAAITLTKQTGTKVTFDTDQKYVRKDIELNIAAQTATPSFKGGALNNKNASASFTNMTTSAINTSGVIIATSGQAGRAAVQYDGAVNGWVNAANSDTALAAVASSSWSGTTYYATGVTLTNGNQFNITVPDGDSTITHTIMVDEEGNVIGIGEGAAITIWDELDENGGYIRHIRAVDLSGDTVTPAALLQGYTAHNALGELIVGTAGGEVTINLQNKTITPSTLQQTITADTGYDGLGTVTVEAMTERTLSTPVVSINNSGLVSATVTQQSGYVEAASKTGTLQLDTQSGATITPTKSAQVAIPANTYALGTINVAAIPSQYIIPTGSLNITSNNTYDVTNLASVTVNVPSSSQTITLQEKTDITPTENSQTITPDTGYDALSSVQINAISSTYIGSDIAQRSSTDLTSSGATVTVPEGYYSAQATKSVATGSIGSYTWTSSTTSTSKTFTANFSNFSAGYISSIGTVAHTFTLQSATITPSTTQQTVTPTSNNHYINSVTIAGDSNLIASNIKSGVPIFGVTGTYTGDSGSGSEITLQAKTHIVPTESSQTITADSGYDGLSSVQIDAISSTYVGSGIDRNDSDDLTVSGATVTVPAGYYDEDASKSVATTTHPKPTVSINSSTGVVTVSHTQGTGYVTGGTTTDTLSLTTQAAKTVTPTESEQNAVASGVYTTGIIKVGAISSTYVGSDIAQRSSTDLTASGATVTVPAGYYAEQATKSVATMTLPTTAASSATSGYTSKATIGRSTSAQYINIPVGYNTSGAYYVINATPNGTVTAPSTVSGSAATVSTGTNTLTLTKTVSITPNVTTAGYISSGTAGNATVTLTANVTTKTAATITPGTSNQTIASGTYLTGTQTIAGDENLIAANIKVGTSIFNVTGTYTSDATASAADIVSGETAYVNGRMLTGTLVIQKYYTGSSAPSASLGANGDIYIQQ